MTVAGEEPALAGRPTEPERPTAIRYRTASRRRRRHLWIVAPLVLVVVFLTLLVVVGIAGRAVAEQYIAGRVEQSLPAGVHGNVDVRLKGVGLLGQFLGGRLNEVDLASDDLAVQGVPVQARLQLKGVPTDLNRPVDTVTGTAVLDDSAIQAILDAQGYPGKAALSNGSVEYTGTTKLFGASVEYAVTARPTISSGRLDLTPLTAEVRSGGVHVDASALLARVAPDGLSVCLAEYLPAGVAIDSLLVGNGTARVGLAGSRVVLTEQALSRRGTCS